jgi:hypothetical protein
VSSKILVPVGMGFKVQYLFVHNFRIRSYADRKHQDISILFAKILISESYTETIY